MAVRAFYRHRSRWRTEADLAPRSRRPHTSRGRTPADPVAWIVKLRAEPAPDNGAGYIRDELAVVAARAETAMTAFVKAVRSHHAPAPCARSHAAAP